MKLELAVVVVTVLSLTALLPRIMSTIMRGRGWEIGWLGDVKSIDTLCLHYVNTNFFVGLEEGVREAVEFARRYRGEIRTSRLLVREYGVVNR